MRAVVTSQSSIDEVSVSGTGPGRTASAPASGPDYAEMMARYLGPGVMRAFLDDDVTEVYLNPQDGRLRVDTRSRGKVDTGIRVEASRVEMFLNTVASHQATTLGVGRTVLQAELPGVFFRGSRLQGFIPPLVSGPCFAIRKPPAVIFSLDDLVAQGVLRPAFRAVIREAIRDRHNILVVGGTNSGKTTFCNAIIREVTELFPADRIALLEDTVELQCEAPDHLALRTVPGISLAQLVKSTLRTSPNRIVVGEVRDEAALDLLDAWATGHPGGCATLHASSAAGALLRLDRLAQRANVPSQSHLIAEAIQFVVVMQGGNGGRRVSELVRVSGLSADGRFVLHACTEANTWVAL